MIERNEERTASRSEGVHDAGNRGGAASALFVCRCGQAGCHRSVVSGRGVDDYCETCFRAYLAEKRASASSAADAGPVHDDVLGNAKELVQRARARADKATKGPWRVGATWDDCVLAPFDEGLAGAGGERVLLRMNKGFPHEAEAAFVAAARTDVPALCDLADALLAENDRLRADISRLCGGADDAESRCLDAWTQLDAPRVELGSTEAKLERGQKELARSQAHSGREITALSSALVAVGSALTAVGFPPQEGEPLAETFRRAWEWSVDHAHKAQETAENALEQAARLNEENARLKKISFVRPLGPRVACALPSPQTAIDVGLNGFAFQLVGETLVHAAPRNPHRLPVIVTVRRGEFLVDVEARFKTDASTTADRSVELAREA